MHTYPIFLVDEYGQPLSARLQATLVTLAPRLQRNFPSLRDDCTVTEILEEAGRRLAAIEERKGPIDSLEAYAWTVVRRMAALRQRLDAWLAASAMRAVDQDGTTLDRLTSAFGTPEQMEAKIFCEQLAAYLTTQERDLLKARQGGLALEEIGVLHGTSTSATIHAWRRLKRKLQSLATSGGRRAVSFAWTRTTDSKRSA